MPVRLGTSVINRIFLTQEVKPPVSSSVVGLLSSSYSNGSTWSSTTGSAVNVVNSPLASGSNGRWQFNGTDDALNIPQSTLDATFVTNSPSAVQQFTFLFYGTIGSLATRRALYGSVGGISYTYGGDAILRTDSSPGSGRIHLDLRGLGATTNRFNIVGDSGSLLNLAITQTSAGVQSVYQNGVFVATSGALANGYAPWRSQNGSDGANICFNNDTDTDNYNGQLGAAYLYNRVLSTTEITQSAQAFQNSFNLVTASVAYLGSSLVFSQSVSPSPTSMSVMTLVVAGGGSGGCGTGGGGGAGGVVYSSSLSLLPGTYAANVGTGAASVGSNNFQSPAGIRGQASSFISGTIIVSASGGGGGVGYDNANASQRDGASGGGQTDNNLTAGTGISGQGSNGGGSQSGTGCGGGGGGKSQNGFPPNTAYPNGRGGAGGSGSAYTIRDGSSVFYGGGGGGGTYAQANSAGRGGPGGGGNGGGPTNNSNCTSGTANTGGGGGGAWRNLDGSNNGISGQGGSGIIVIAYLTASFSSSNFTVSSGGIITDYTSGSAVYRSHTFLSSSNLVLS